MRALNRFDVMACQLRGHVLPEPPALPGRVHRITTPDDGPDLPDRADMTLGEIAAAAGITRQRASQRRQRAIATGDWSALLTPSSHPAAVAANTRRAAAHEGHEPESTSTMSTTTSAANTARNLEGLRAQHKQHIATMERFAKIMGERDLTSEEQASYDDAKRKAAMLKPAIEGSMDVLISVHNNADSDPQRGFASMGDYGLAVALATNARRAGRATDSRLAPLAAAPSTSSNEGSGGDGGFLVPPAFAHSMFSLSLGEDSLLPQCDDLPVDGNSLILPTDETTPWGTTGIRAFWGAEAAAITPTKPLLGGDELRLKKISGLVPVSNELLADGAGAALATWLPGKLGDSIQWKANEAILYGTGAGTPLGIYAGNATVTVAKDSGQAAGTLSAANLAGMFSRLPPGSHGRAIWQINNDALPALLVLTLGNYPVMMPLGSADVGAFQGKPIGLIFGRPVIVSQHANTFSSKGDIQLFDLKYYQAITKPEGMVAASSMHLYFDADAMAYRVTFRMDGTPKLKAPIAPAKGSNSLSPFVQLGAR